MEPCGSGRRNAAATMSPVERRCRCIWPTNVQRGLGIATTARDLAISRNRLRSPSRAPLNPHGAGCSINDNIGKPFSYPELVARIRAVLRRSGLRPVDGILDAGPVQIDTRHRQVTVESRPVELTATEYRLACTLASEPTRVFTRSDLTEALWGCRQLRGRTLDSHAHRLRTKLANNSRRVVLNVWGVGYCLVQGSSVHNDGF